MSQSTKFKDVILEKIIKEVYFINNIHMNNFLKYYTLYKINRFTYSKVVFLYLMTIDDHFITLLDSYYNDILQSIESIEIDDTYSYSEVNYLEYACKILELKDKVIIRDPTVEFYYKENNLDYSVDSVVEYNKDKILKISESISTTKKLNSCHKRILNQAIKLYLKLIESRNNNYVETRNQTKSIKVRLTEEEYDEVMTKITESNSPSISFYLRKLLFSDQEVKIDKELNKQIDELLEVYYGNNMHLNEIIKSLATDKNFDKDTLPYIVDLSNNLRNCYKSLNQFSKKI